MSRFESEGAHTYGTYTLCYTHLVSEFEHDLKAQRTGRRRRVLVVRMSDADIDRLDALCDRYNGVKRSQLVRALITRASNEAQEAS